MGALKNYKKYKPDKDFKKVSNSEENKKRITVLRHAISSRLENDISLQKKAASIIEKLMNQK